MYSEEDEGKSLFIIDYSKFGDLEKKRIILEEQFKDEEIINLDEENFEENPLKMTKNLLKFLISQLQFYSAVSFDRNYLWKKEITKNNNFPKEYLLKNIWNKDFPSDLRACFAKLSISLYLNESPFNPISLPTMCRVFDESEHNFKFSSILKSLGTIKATLEKEKDAFSALITESLGFLRKTTNNLNKEMWKNDLVLHVLEIFSILIRTNVFEYLNQKENYFELMGYLTQILNFDEKSKKVKENKKEKKKNKKVNL